MTVLEPGCTEKGKEELQCTRCHEKLDERDVNPLGHAGSEWTVVLEPSCTEKGKEELQCTRCHEKYDERDIDPLGHNYEDWTVTKKPTCTESGKEELFCTRCHEKYDERDIDPLGHDQGTWRVVKQPTAEEEGIRELHCNRCDFLLDTQYFSQMMVYNQTVCSQGFRFRDVTEGKTDKWYMFTPVDLTKDGVTEIPLIAANLYIVGNVNVTVADGKMKVEYHTDYRVDLEDITFTVFTSLNDVTD